MDSKIIRFTNCQILRDHKIITEDLWVRNGKIENPEPIYYLEQRLADISIDCKNLLIAPGYIDLQINGHFGYDFSNCYIDLKEAIQKTATGLLRHGVTAFCPTLVTQSKESYRKILPQIKRRAGSKSFGATNLGIHLEGPFISREKKGAHPLEYVKGNTIQSIDEIKEMYKYLDDVSIITIAPELDPSGAIVSQLVDSGITVSVGHSMATLQEGERAINCGANFITHLFNAMLPFHHRDPGLVGLLTSSAIKKPVVYYGIIADGIHTHYAALRIAFRSNFEGMVLVSDAISAAGLESGTHKIGVQEIEIKDNKAYIAGTDTLCGSIAALDYCVKHLRQVTGCSTVEAIECATTHAAQVLGISQTKGTLNFGADADFNILDPELNVLATFISGQLVSKTDNTFDINI